MNCLGKIDDLAFSNLGLIKVLLPALFIVSVDDFSILFVSIVACRSRTAFAFFTIEPSR